MEIEKPQKKHEDSEESSSEDNEIGKVSEKIDLKLELLSPFPQEIPRKDQLFLTNHLFIALWGTSSIFLQAISNELSAKKQAVLIGYLNFNKNKQKSLANVYFIMKSHTFFIVFNEIIKEYSEIDFEAFFMRNFLVDSKKFEMVIFSGISNKLLKNIDDLERIRVISSNFLSKEKTEALKIMGKALEEGNSIDGFPAEIVMFCEMKGLEANLYLGVNDEYEFNIKDVKKYASVAKNYEDLKVEIDEKNISEIIKKMNKLNYSSIYL